MLQTIDNVLEENIYSDPELSLLPKMFQLTTANIVGYIGSIMENEAVAVKA